MANRNDEDDHDRDDEATDDSEGSEERMSSPNEAQGESREEGADALERTADEGTESGVAPANLGVQRYVLAGYFAGGMVFAYVLGRALHAIWAFASNKDAFALNLPSLAAVPDETKLTYSIVFAGVVSVVLVARLLRDPEMRVWTDEVTAELLKVKWPSKKDVQNSTVVVIATSVVATAYLFLLDHFWGFVTNLIYGASP
jgi:preprotein translocase subunit SecE